LAAVRLLPTKSTRSGEALAAGAAASTSSAMTAERTIV
jgi:hypothetical protein